MGGGGGGNWVRPSRASILSELRAPRVKLAGRPGAPGFIGTSTVRTRDNEPCRRISMSLLCDSFGFQVCFLWLIVLLCGFGLETCLKKWRSCRQARNVALVKSTALCRGEFYLPLTCFFSRAGLRFHRSHEIRLCIIVIFIKVLR